MKFIFFLLLMIPVAVSGKQRYIVFFADKGLNSTFYHPADIIGKTAAEKRLKAGIGIDYNDLPVAAEYKQLLIANNSMILRSSKWLNAVLVETTLGKKELSALSDKITSVIPGGNSADENKISKFGDGTQTSAAKGSSFNYGFASGQNSLINIDCLHDQGFTGKGVTVAFFDCGFPGVDTVSHFDSLIKNNRVKGTFDFWANIPGVYYKDHHGTYCASVVLAQKNGSFVGTAPDANALFAITDDAVTETPQDEFNYAAALEWADSLGADVISASISYKTFDNPIYNYSYSDMDGKTAISTKACRIAAAKGLLIVNAAGNSGTICAPCDADSILCVGGANGNARYDNISSRGPSFDGRTKPDVAARTLNVYTINENGNQVAHAYGGTSTATPQIAGLAICLKQKHPTASVVQVIKAIQQSANQSNNPDSLIGYGVPNACKADYLLSVALEVSGAEVKKTQLNIYPNPAGSVLYYQGTATIRSVQVISMLGKTVAMENVNQTGGVILLHQLPAGSYLLRVIYENGQAEVTKFNHL